MISGDNIPNKRVSKIPYTYSTPSGTLDASLEYDAHNEYLSNAQANGRKRLITIRNTGPFYPEDTQGNYTSASNSNSEISSHSVSIQNSESTQLLGSTRTIKLSTSSTAYNVNDNTASNYFFSETRYDIKYPNGNLYYTRNASIKSSEMTLSRNLDGTYGITIELIVRYWGRLHHSYLNRYNASTSPYFFPITINSSNQLVLNNTYYMPDFSILAPIVYQDVSIDDGAKQSLKLEHWSTATTGMSNPLNELLKVSENNYIELMLELSPTIMTTYHPIVSSPFTTNPINSSHYTTFTRNLRDLSIDTSITEPPTIDAVITTGGLPSDSLSSISTVKGLRGNNIESTYEKNANLVVNLNNALLKMLGNYGRNGTQWRGFTNPYLTNQIPLLWDNLEDLNSQYNILTHSPGWDAFFHDVIYTGHIKVAL